MVPPLFKPPPPELLLVPDTRPAELVVVRVLELVDDLVGVCVDVTRSVDVDTAPPPGGVTVMTDVMTELVGSSGGSVEASGVEAGGGDDEGGVEGAVDGGVVEGRLVGGFDVGGVEGSVLGAKQKRYALVFEPQMVHERSAHYSNWEGVVAGSSRSRTKTAAERV